MGCILVVFTGLLEYCAVLYVSKLEQKIKLPKFLEKRDKVEDNSKTASASGSKIIMVNDKPKIEEQRDSQEVTLMNKNNHNNFESIFQDMKKYSISLIQEMEKWSKIIIPVFFIFFNILYWSIYASQYFIDKWKFNWVNEH